MTNVRLEWRLQRGYPEQPRALELPGLVFAGIEAARGEGTVATWRSSLDTSVAPAPSPPARLAAAGWPPIVRRLLDTVARPMPLREALARMAQSGSAASEALHALEVTLAARLLVLG